MATVTKDVCETYNDKRQYSKDGNVTVEPYFIIQNTMMNDKPL